MLRSVEDLLGMKADKFASREVLTISLDCSLWVGIGKGIILPCDMAADLGF